MKKILSRIAAISLASMLIFSVNVSTASAASPKLKTVIESSSTFNGVFSPFFYTTAYDANVIARVHPTLWELDRKAQFQDGCAIYKEPVVKKDANGKDITVYTFKLKDNVKFSDGKAMTADDIIFNYKVYLDPTYDGVSTLTTTAIQGMNEYIYDDPAYADKIKAIDTKSKEITDDQIKEYAYTLSETAVMKLGVEPAMKELGYKNDKNLTGDALRTSVIQTHMDKEIATKKLDSFKTAAIAYRYKTLIKEYKEANLKGGAKVPEISGIKKLDAKTVEVTINGIDPKAIHNLSLIRVLPSHYYGVSSDGKTKFAKGNLQPVRTRNSTPMGAGAFKFKSYENNVVSFEPNPTYFKGAPKYNFKYVVVATGNELDSIGRGDVDITAPQANPENVKSVKDAGYHYELVDNNGYGYIAINANKVKDIHVRKAMMYLFDRKPAIDAYYGELAVVIERPLTRVSWAYPENAKEFYGFNPAKALEEFKLAGYTQTQDGSKNVLKKDGTQFKIECIFPGGETQNHPSAGIIQKLKVELEKLGGNLDVRSLEFAQQSDIVNAGEAQMYTMAWSSTADPDLYQIYHSQGPSNRNGLKNTELDDLIVKARTTTVIEERKKYYARCLDIVMEEAVEMPLYQRKNLQVFNKDIIDVNSLPKNPTPFYDYSSEREKMIVK